MCVHADTARQWIYELFIYSYKRKPLPRGMMQRINRKAKEINRAEYKKALEKRIARGCLNQCKCSSCAKTRARNRRAKLKWKR